MPSFFRLVTAHGDTLAIQAGRLVACRTTSAAGVIPVVASRVGALVVLTADANDAIGFAPSGKSLAGSLLVLGSVTKPGRLALVHPATRRYLNAAPLQAPAAPIGAADALQAWEWFTPQGIGDVPVRAGAAARLAAMRSLLEGGLSASNILRHIEAGGQRAAQVLDAALAMIETETLDALARRVVSDTGLRDALARLYPGDPWASTALPDLAALREKPPVAPPPGFFGRILRGRGRKALEDQAPEPALPLRRRTIGPEFDLLGAKGIFGDFVSLPHACNARARRLEPQGEGVAVVTTARNEGIYLLEWIAYHRCLGARAIYIYSNDNQDGSDALLGALADAGIITWIDSRLGGAVGNAQFKAYGHALGCMPDLLGYEWVLVVDVDEFLVLDHERFAGLPDFAAWHRRRGADTVAINWQFMAPEEDGDPCTVPLTRRNTRVLGKHQVGDGVRLVKSMSRPNRVAHSEAHVPFADERSHIATDHASGAVHDWHNPPAGFPPCPKFSDRIVTGPAVINHYFFKSAAEWMWKLARNRGDHGLIPGEAREPMGEEKARDYLRQLHASGLVIDERAKSCAPDLDQETHRLLSEPRISAAAASVQNAYHARLASIRRLYADSPKVAAWAEDSRPFLRLAGCAMHQLGTVV
jgi:hypothetical protein